MEVEQMNKLRYRVVLEGHAGDFETETEAQALKDEIVEKLYNGQPLTKGFLAAYVLQDGKDMLDYTLVDLDWAAFARKKGIDPHPEEVSFCL